MKTKISFLTNVRCYNGSMKIEIFDRDRCVYVGENLESGPGRIDFSVDWPTKVTIISSNKQNNDTLCDECGKIIEDKSIEITGILINEFAVQIDTVDQLFNCQRQGAQDITHENYWGFNGHTTIDFNRSSPLRYMLELGNKFDMTRFDWGQM